MIFIALGLLSILSLPPENNNLQSFLDELSKSSEEVKSFELLSESAQSEIRARDLELVTELSTQVRQVWDDRATATSSNRHTSRDGQLTFTKGLPTGTELTASGFYDFTKDSSSGNLHRLDWSAEIQQSLWRNVFGRGTRLRQSADRFELLSRHAQLAYSKAEKILSFEVLFWDFVLVEQEIEALTANLERSQKSEAWIKKRLANSAAEKSDLLQAQSLVSQRELELQDASDRRDRLRLRLNEITSSAEWVKTWSPSQEEVSVSRNLDNFVEGSKVDGDIPVRTDSLANVYLASSLKEKAKKVQDEFSPELNLFGGVGSNAVERGVSRSMTNSFDNRYVEVGVRFSLDLNFWLKADAVRAAQRAADAQDLRSVYLLRESSLSWIDLQKNIERLNKRLKVATQLANLQKQKSAEERRRYEQGRTTAFQAFSFEQEATEAELFAQRLQIQIRKEEAQARLYAWSNGEKLN